MLNRANYQLPNNNFGPGATPRPGFGAAHRRRRSAADPVRPAGQLLGERMKPARRHATCAWALLAALPFAAAVHAHSPHAHAGRGVVGLDVLRPGQRRGPAAGREGRGGRHAAPPALRRRREELAHRPDDRERTGSGGHATAGERSPDRRRRRQAGRAVVGAGHVAFRRRPARDGAVRRRRTHLAARPEPGRRRLDGEPRVRGPASRRRRAVAPGLARLPRRGAGAARVRVGRLRARPGRPT